MGSYSINPDAPCLTRCQIKRAMDAWGGLFRVDPDKLLAKYRHMEAVDNAQKTLVKTHVGLEQRLGAAERGASTAWESKEQKAALGRLRKVHEHIKQQIHVLSQPAAKGHRHNAMLAAHGVDVEHVMMDKYERRAAAEKSVWASKTRVARLLRALPTTRLTAGTSKQVRDRFNAVQHEVEHLSTQINQAGAKMNGSPSDTKLASDLQLQATRQEKAVAQLGRMLHSDRQLGQLRQQFDDLHGHVKKAVASANLNRGGQQAVELEMLRKADAYSARNLGEANLTGESQDKRTLEQIAARLRRQQDVLDAYTQLSSHQVQSDSIKGKLAALERKMQAAEDPAGFEASLKAMYVYLTIRIPG